jgi:hypothetical protein
MPKFQDAQSVLETLYYISGIVVASVAVFGLRQLSLLKRSLKQSAELSRVSAKREAFKLAADQCRFYLEVVIPSQNKCYLDPEMKDALNHLDSFSVEVSATGIRLNPPKLAKPDDKVFPFNQAQLLTILAMANSLEAFAVFFVSGVAAEAIAFNSIGVTYCHTAKGLAPFMVAFGSNDHFQHALHLFILWQMRIDRQELQNQHDEVSEKLGRAQDIRIKPIGM